MAGTHDVRLRIALRTRFTSPELFYGIKQRSVIVDIQCQTANKHFKHPQQQVKQHVPVELKEQTESDVHDSSQIIKMDCYLRTTGIIRYTSIIVCPLTHKYKEGQRHTEHKGITLEWNGMRSRTKSQDIRSIGERGYIIGQRERIWYMRQRHGRC